MCSLSNGINSCSLCFSLIEVVNLTYGSVRWKKCVSAHTSEIHMNIVEVFGRPFIELYAKTQLWIYFLFIAPVMLRTWPFTRNSAFLLLLLLLLFFIMVAWHIIGSWMKSVCIFFRVHIPEFALLLLINCWRKKNCIWPCIIATGHSIWRTITKQPIKTSKINMTDVIRSCELFSIAFFSLFSLWWSVGSWIF